MLGYKPRPGELDRVCLQQNQKKTYQCPLKNHVRSIAGHTIYDDPVYFPKIIYSNVFFSFSLIELW